MKPTRREFLKTISLLGLGLFVSSKILASSLIDTTSRIYNYSLNKIIAIIAELKKERSSIVLKVMDGKEYVNDPYYHYPVQGGIVDDVTNSRVFFHIHRENEYGHFHTFIEDEDGELIHLVMISMDEEGIPFRLSTVNTWVTGDKYIKSDKLKILFTKFKIDNKLFKDERLLQFIQYVFDAYKDEIENLFDERDEWVKQYVRKYTREPFEDREFELLSSKLIDVYSDKSSS